MRVAAVPIRGPFDRGKVDWESTGAARRAEAWRGRRALAPPLLSRTGGGVRQGGGVVQSPAHLPGSPHPAAGADGARCDDAAGSVDVETSPRSPPLVVEPPAPPVRGVVRVAPEDVVRAEFLATARSAPVEERQEADVRDTAATGLADGNQRGEHHPEGRREREQTSTTNDRSNPAPRRATVPPPREPNAGRLSDPPTPTPPEDGGEAVRRRRRRPGRTARRRRRRRAAAEVAERQAAGTVREGHLDPEGRREREQTSTTNDRSNPSPRRDVEPPHSGPAAAGQPERRLQRRRRERRRPGRSGRRRRRKREAAAAAAAADDARCEGTPLEGRREREHTSTTNDHRSNPPPRRAKGSPQRGPDVDERPVDARQRRRLRRRQKAKAAAGGPPVESAMQQPAPDPMVSLRRRQRKRARSKRKWEARRAEDDRVDREFTDAMLIAQARREPTVLFQPRVFQTRHWTPAPAPDPLFLQHFRWEAGRYEHLRRQ